MLIKVLKKVLNMGSLKEDLESELIDYREYCDAVNERFLGWPTDKEIKADPALQAEVYKFEKAIHPVKINKLIIPDADHLKLTDEKMCRNLAAWTIKKYRK